MDNTKAISILFVDDEKLILNGLKRPLHSMRHAWDMTFVESGREGLEILAKKKIDLIISDMCMPEMDGAAFLRAARESYPQTIRTILSGHSGEALTLETLKPAHKFLHKPCPSEKIIDWVNKILFFRQILPNTELQSFLNGIGVLPSQPLFFPMILEAIAQGSPQKVGESIAFDVNMAANIMKATLNAFFVQPTRLPTLEEAAKTLSLDLLFELVSSKNIFASYNSSISLDFPVDTFWRHCLRTAKYAKTIASMESSDPLFINQCYLGGLFHDLGKFLLHSHYGQNYIDLLKETSNQNKEVFHLEMANLNCCHGMAGAYLLGIWGLPMEIVEAVAFHSRPSRMKKYTVSPLCIVHVANAFDHIFFQTSNDDPIRKLDMPFLQQTITKEKLQAWRYACNLGFQARLDTMQQFIW